MMMIDILDCNLGEAAQQEADDVHWGPGQCREHPGRHLRNIPQVQKSLGAIVVSHF